MMATIRFNKEEFMNVFREFRGESSQEEIASELGLGRSTISLLENGKQLPTLDILQRICEKVDKNIDTFFITEKEDPILLLMGKIKPSDKEDFRNVFDKLRVREHYLAINKRLEAE